MLCRLRHHLLQVKSVLIAKCPSSWIGSWGAAGLWAGVGSWAVDPVMFSTCVRYNGDWDRSCWGAYISIIYTLNLGWAIAVPGWEREQGRFRGSSEGAARKHGGASREHGGSKGEHGGALWGSAGAQYAKAWVSSPSPAWLALRWAAACYTPLGLSTWDTTGTAIAHPKCVEMRLD